MTRQPYLSAEVTQLTVCRAVFLNRGPCPVFDELYPGICLDHGIHSALVLNTELGHPGLCSSKTLISPAQQLLARRTHLRTFFTSIQPSPYAAFIRLWILIGTQPATVKNSITDHCFIRKSVEALITNKPYCLRASNIELELNTNILVLHYPLPNARTKVSFLPRLATPVGRRPYLSINLCSNIELLLICLIDTLYYQWAHNCVYCSGCAVHRQIGDYIISYIYAPGSFVWDCG